jgi:hypothetical protein
LSGLGTNDSALKQAADALAGLNPDVILLQGVRDWQLCAQLADALKPSEYYVLICSSFRDAATSDPSNDQLGVLSKAKAYFSWSEPWQGTNAPEGGGFAFVALQLKGQRLGFFCLNCPDPVTPSASAQQVRQQVNAVGQWEANRVQSLIMGLSFAGNGPEQQPLREQLVTLLRQAGFLDTFQALPSSERATRPSGTDKGDTVSDFILTQPATFPVSPQVSRSPVARSYPVTCDLELDPLRVAAGWSALAQELEQRSAAARQPEQNPNLTEPAPASKSIAAQLPQPVPGAPALWYALGGAMAVFVLFSVWFMVRVARQSVPRSPRLLPSSFEPDVTTTSSYTVVMSLPSETGSLDQDISIPSQPQSSVQDLPTVHTQSATWEERARAAEQNAERAQSILRDRLAGTLGRWLKQKFVRKLVSDRAQLLESQQNAAFKAMKVDERLARIEKQVQQQTQLYELKIEELTRDLHAAREENRELIRARIAQVKLEMEAVRARMMAQAEQEFGSTDPET